MDDKKPLQRKRKRRSADLLLTFPDDAIVSDTTTVKKSPEQSNKETKQPMPKTTKKAVLNKSDDGKGQQTTPKGKAVKTKGKRPSKKSEKLLPAERGKRDLATKERRKRKPRNAGKTTPTKDKQQEQKKAKKQKSTSEYNKVLAFLGFSKPPSEAILDDLGYPKHITPPVDIDIIEGVQYEFFNIKKYLHYQYISEEHLKKYKLQWLMKLIPMGLLDRLTFNKDITDSYARNLFKNVYNYNHYNSTFQFEFDQKRRRVRTIVFGSILTVIVSVFYVIALPNIKFNQGIDYLSARDYRSAYEAFNQSSREEATVYAQYAEAFGVASQGQFKEGEAILNNLRRQNLSYLNVDEALSEYHYAEGDYWVKQENYANAARAFRQIIHYKDGRNRFNETAYQSADQLMASGNEQEAIQNLELIGNYKDSQQKKIDFIETIYSEAKELYALGLYGDAGKLFESIAQYGYKDSSTMVIQSYYHEGIMYYSRGDFEQAVSTLNKIKTFKDTTTILKDIYYRIGKEYLEQGDLWEAYQNLTQAYDYKDSIELLKLPSMILYGDWHIVGSNGAAVDPVPIRFNDQYEFKTEWSIAGIETNKPYRFDGTQYITETQSSVVRVEPISHTKIYLYANDGTVEYQYEMNRIEQTKAMFDTNVRMIEEILNNYLKTTHPEQFQLNEVEQTEETENSEEIVESDD